MSDDMKPVNFMSPADLKDAFDAATEYGEKSEIFRDAMREHVGGAATADPDEIRAECDSLDGLLDTVDALADPGRRVPAEDVEEIAAYLGQRRDTLRAEAERAEADVAEATAKREADQQAALDAATEILCDGRHLFTDHAAVRRVADAFGVSEERAIGLLHERHPDVPACAFVTRPEADRHWPGDTTDRDGNRKWPSLADPKPVEPGSGDANPGCEGDTSARDDGGRVSSERAGELLRERNTDGDDVAAADVEATIRIGGGSE